MPERARLIGAPVHSVEPPTATTAVPDGRSAYAAREQTDTVCRQALANVFGQTVRCPTAAPAVAILQEAIAALDCVLYARVPTGECCSAVRCTFVCDATCTRCRIGLL